MERIMLIDGSNLIFRAFYAIPVLNAPDGRPVNAVYGFISMYLKSLQDYNPDYVIVAQDLPSPTFRHEVFPAYKGTRKELPEELIPQFAIHNEALDAMKIPRLSVQGYEADDIFGTISRIGEESGYEVLLLSGDRDVMQLVSDKTRVIYPKGSRGMTEAALMGAAEVEALLGVPPDMVTDLKGLMGDSSDNIPGIKGVGEKTALKLLEEYKTLEGVLSRAGEIKGKLSEKVAGGADLARLSKQLATIDRNVPLPDGFDIRCRPVPLAETGARELFTRLGFKTLLGRLDSGKIPAAPRAQNEVQNEIPSKIQNEVSPKSQNEALPSQNETPPPAEDKAAPHITCDTMDALNSLLPGLGEQALYMDSDGISLSGDAGTVVIPFMKDLLSGGLSQESVLEALEPWLVGGERKLIHGDKLFLEKLRYFGIELGGDVYDTAVAAYVLDPQSKTDLPSLLNEAGIEGEPAARALLKLKTYQLNRMRGEGLIRLYEEVEHPLTSVLRSMERIGFMLDRNVLITLGDSFSERIDALRKDIYELAGTQFNINSPKQLGEILFEKLGLPAGKKTKTGYSTNVDVLEDLSDKHPIIAPILEYRSYMKLNSTYIEGLLKLIGVDGRVKTRFDQTSTATGRISSQEPNLQNIPVRTPLGRGIRKAFIAADGNVLVDADYSQIELRVLAHMSGDKGMLEAFTLAQDIHRHTAAEVYGVPLDEVTDEMRSAAKAVNFGIVYGISDFGLARNIGVSRKEAGSFIERYFERYPGVKAYMEETVRRGKELGYVTTLLGRRRYLPELKSSNYQTRSFGERAAMNTPIQGTAADIIKVAMVRTHAALQGTDAHLILQVHDELIVECREKDVEMVKTILKSEMESAMELSVPLKADIAVGKSWYYTK